MKKFFSKLTEYRLNPNQFYVLYCIHMNEEARFINPHLEMRVLRSFNYLDKYNKITKEGYDLLKAMESMEKTSHVKDTAVLSDEFINAYYEMWPKGKLPSGKYARVDKKNLDTAFKWFFKTYKYSTDTILKATGLYLDHYETKGWLYMRTSQYFIRKMENDKSITSELADYCNTVESGNTDSADKNHFKDKVV